MQINQSILIDGLRSIPQEQLYFSVKQYGMIGADLSINAQTIEVFTKDKARKVGSSYHECQLVSFKRNLYSEDKNSPLIKVDIVQKSDVPIITTYSHTTTGHNEEMKQMMSSYMYKMLQCDTNTVHSKFNILVNIKSNLTFICIIRHMQIDNGCKDKFSVFYDLPSQNDTKDSASGQTQHFQIKWLGCVPISIIADLYSYLYFLLHSTPVEFTIPHQLLSEKRMTILHTTKTLECYQLVNVADHVRGNIAKLYGYVDNQVNFVAITEKDILDFEETNLYIRNENLSKFVNNLDISESDFNRIAYAFIIGKNSTKHHFETRSCVFERASRYETICFYTFNTESSVVLNICEVIESSYKDKLFDITKLLTRMLSLYESLDAAKEYAYIEKYENSGLLLIMSIIIGIGDLMRYDTKGICLQEYVVCRQFEVIFKQYFLTYYEENIMI